MYLLLNWKYIIYMLRDIFATIEINNSFTYMFITAMIKILLWYVVRAIYLSNMTVESLLFHFDK